MLYRLRRNNQRWRSYDRFLVNENRWRAQRYGFDNGLIDLGRGNVVPYRDLVEEIIELTAPDAEHFGCTEEVQHALKIIDRGTSADRQIRCFDEAKQGGAGDDEALQAVVDQLIAETAEQ